VALGIMKISILIKIRWVRKNVFNYLCSKILVAMREWFLIMGASGKNNLKSNPL